MNRSILIVICDFLLVSLLAFSSADINKASQTGAPRLMQSAVATNQVTGRQDLGDVMRLALDDERKNREALLVELTSTRDSVGQRDQQIQNFQAQLRARQSQAYQLQEEQTNLQRQFSVAQSNIDTLNQQLRVTTVETVITKEQRAAMEAEARKQTEKAGTLEKQLADLQNSNRLMQAQREALNNELQMTQEANRSAFVQVSQLQEDLQAQRQENTKLAEGVKVLAGKSSELAQEIRDNRPLAPNLIFEDLVTNRLLTGFHGLKQGLFGLDSRYKEAQTVLVSDGASTFALCHIQDTPLALWNPGTQWQELTGTMVRGSAVIPINSISFYSTDPRIVLIPVSTADAKALGSKVYRLSNDPYKFQDAVVIGTRDNYYGESSFQIDLTAPGYLKMDHNSLKGLFGKFNPSSGDLVLSKTGELMGVMANNSYCVMIRSFQPAATFRFGADSRNQPTAQTLSTLYAFVTEMPYKLQ
jgi:hypothetical protein